MRRINQRPNPLPATIAGHLLPLAWTDPDVQAFRALADRHDCRLAPLSGSIAGALLGLGHASKITRSPGRTMLISADLANDKVSHS